MTSTSRSCSIRARSTASGRVSSRLPPRTRTSRRGAGEARAIPTRHHLHVSFGFGSLSPFQDPSFQKGESFRSIGGDLGSGTLRPW
eukprot:scaffold431_cov334-Pavlova_lutheri.AAC.110